MAFSPSSDKASTKTRVAKQPRSLRSRLAYLTAILASTGGILLLLYLDGLLGNHAELPIAGDALNYGLLFFAGLFTGFHCIGMCGALVVGYSIDAARNKSPGWTTHLLYGTGKTLSYTLIGALFGALGAIVTFTPLLRGIAGIVAGVFLLLFGLSLLNIFAPLNRFRIKTPGFVMRFVGKAYRKNKNPFVIGLLNGLMVICGPLQAMYIMAAGTGNPLAGAKLLLVFGTGTLPVMMSFGFLAGTLSKQIAPKIVKASGIIVIALGAIMLNRGLAMTGSGYDFESIKRHIAAPQSEAPVDPLAGHHHHDQPSHDLPEWAKQLNEKIDDWLAKLRQR